MKNSKGIALPLVLITMLVLGVLGSVVMQFGVTDTKQVARDLSRTQAFYAARAGADAMAEYLIKNPSTAAATVSKTSPTNRASGDLGDGRTFSVYVEGTIDTGLAITAQGTSNGVVQSVRLDVGRAEPAAIFEDVIYTYADLDVASMKTIIGSVTSAGNITIPNNFGYNHSPYTYRYYPSPIIPTLPTDLINGTSISIGNNQTKTINDSYAYTSITMSPNGTLVFDVGDRVMKVVIDNFETKGSVFVNVTGKGRLELYITTSADIQTPLVLNDGNPNSLFIFLKDGASFNMTANGTTNAYIYGPYAEVAIQSAFSTIRGAIISDVVVKMPNGLQPSIGNVIYAQIDTDLDFLDAIVILRRNEWRDAQ